MACDVGEEVVEDPLKQVRPSSSWLLIRVERRHSGSVRVDIVAAVDTVAVAGIAIVVGTVIELDSVEVFDSTRDPSS